MTLYNDLEDAKALIDTPEKWNECEMSVIQAVARATKTREAYTKAKAALYAHVPASFARASVFDALHAYDRSAPSHPDIMALFQRAIDAAKVSA